MARWWKEPYTSVKAEELDIRDGAESYLVTGSPNAKWIFHVNVCAFTFSFYSLDMMNEYLEYYNQKILPSRADWSIWIGEPQTKFNRLPLYLREEPKRQKVIKALTKALAEFRKES